ncbi:MAG: hypothetical protein QOK25_2495 [Thermoleophilaceae bacterium]|jgi:diguanylate cyclase (GGDEF)-like protein|nr:hypothetical protein [Thermoleophilaceae bacterium]
MPNPRRLYRWVRGESGRSQFAFAVRLFLAVGITLSLTGAAVYTAVAGALERYQVDAYAGIQRADAAGIELAASQHPRTAFAEIRERLQDVGRRPGARKAILVDRHSVVVSASRPALIGTKDLDPSLRAAVERGAHHSGRDSQSAADQRDFDFISPVSLRGGRYALEVAYDHNAFQAQLDDIRRILLLLGLAALVAGNVLFYVVGGRALLRSHRIALQRAMRDGLTDLPNQRAFQDELEPAVAAAARSQAPLALAVLDIDGFKRFNDRHGHPRGDDLLKRVATTLRRGRSGDRAYRIGGDEFAVVLPHTDSEGAGTMAIRLGRALTEVGAPGSIGVSALRPGGTADSLRAEADAALYEAKRRGSHIGHYDDIRDDVVLTTSEKRAAVHRLIDEGRVETVFQPIWDLAEGSMLGVEALTRPDPSYELAGPLEAFEIAEQMGRVHELDVVCVEHALEIGSDLPDDALLFVNLSPRTLDLDADGDDWLCLAVERAGIPIERVVVEVTERFGGRTASVVKCLRHLRGQGFKIALDDVGTGNSGLEMLRQVDAEFVKLDRSIVTAAATEPNARAVLMAMATFARQTGAFVIAEGIEDKDTLDFLRGIDDAERPDAIIQGGQGYGLGRPSPDLPSASPSLLPRPAVAT